MPARDSTYRLFQHGRGAAQGEEAEEEQLLLLCEEAPACVESADSDASEEERLCAEPLARRRTRLAKIAFAVAGVAALVASVSHVRPAAARGALADVFGSVTEVAVVEDAEPLCLCLFDVDRTITAKQLDASDDDTTPQSRCEGVQDRNAADFAFGAGRLRLSPLGHRVEETECARCRRGAISAGGVGGAKEQQIVAEMLGVADSWSSASAVASPLVRFCQDGRKHVCTRDILRWYSRRDKIEIRPEDVYVYDDVLVNVLEFKGTGYNAKQVSCGSRDGTLGLCGSSIEEIQLQKGVNVCETEIRAK